MIRHVPTYRKIKVLLLLSLLLSETFMQGAPADILPLRGSFYQGDTISHTDSLRNLLKVIPLSDTAGQYNAINPWYGVQFYGDGVIFMAHAKKRFKTLSEYVSFGDFDTYYTPLKDFHPGTPEYFSKKKSFPIPPGAVSFTKDGTILYFSKAIKNFSGQIKYVIYPAKKDSATGTWLPAEKPFPFCADSYSCMHPAISADGKTLVFSSDMPARQGGFNLYKSTMNRRSWSKPVNLGSPINSDADELFPYLDDYNNLYFSSNRDSVLHGFDIYVARFNGRGWDPPIRLGKEINSQSDELMFKVRRNDTLALLVSVPDSGVSRLHFYRLSLSDSMKIPPAVTVATGPGPGTMKQAKKAPLPEVAAQTQVPPPKIVQPRKVVPPPVVPVVVPKPKPEPELQKKPSDIVFKVQIVASMVPSGSYAVWINHKKYITWEYFYQGAYRYTIGEFDNVEDALKLKALCRQQGYPQAFVAAFRNNKRVLDPAVFKH